MTDEELYKEADDALYRAKDAGRNSISWQAECLKVLPKAVNSRYYEKS